MTRSTPRYYSPAFLLLAATSLSTGCATVADMGAGMLGPDAVEKVQHRRQSKELDAVKAAQDVDRAAQMCEQGMDKNDLALKPDLRVAACESYAEMMVPAVQQSSCEEFVTLQPTLLRFNETQTLNAESDARANACEQQFAEAQAAAEAEARAEVLAKLQSQASREEYGKICKDSKYAGSLGLDDPSRKLICKEYVTMSTAEIAQADCGTVKQVAPAVYKEAEEVSVGRDALGTLRETWLTRATSCEAWGSIFNDLVHEQTYHNERNTAYVLLKNAREQDEGLVNTLYEKMTTPDYVIEGMTVRGRANFAYAIATLAVEDESVGKCETFGKMLDVLEPKQGRHYVLDYLTKRDCEGYRDRIEKMLVSDEAMERKFACHYLAKFGDKGSIKKMRTLSYTDSYEHKYTYPVRTACRDAYGKLELKLSN